MFGPHSCPSVSIVCVFLKHTYITKVMFTSQTYEIDLCTFLEMISCPVLPTVSNSVSNHTNPTNNYKEVVTYTCNVGYERTAGALQRTCQDDKTWSGTSPGCSKLIKMLPAQE